jgi:hypothetical protein
MSAALPFISASSFYAAALSAKGRMIRCIAIGSSEHRCRRHHAASNAEIQPHDDACARLSTLMTCVAFH